MDLDKRREEIRAATRAMRDDMRSGVAKVRAAHNARAMRDLANVVNATPPDIPTGARPVYDMDKVVSGLGLNARQERKARELATQVMEDTRAMFRVSKEAINSGLNRYQAAELMRRSLELRSRSSTVRKSDILRKGAPRGFTPIQNSKKGGYRKPRAGGGFQYWYPDTGVSVKPHGEDHGDIHEEHEAATPSKEVRDEALKIKALAEKHGMTMDYTPNAKTTMETLQRVRGHVDHGVARMEYEKAAEKAGHSAADIDEALKGKTTSQINEARGQLGKPDADEEAPEEGGEEAPEEGADKPADPDVQPSADEGADEEAPEEGGEEPADEEPADEEPADEEAPSEPAEPDVQPSLDEEPAEDDEDWEDWEEEDHPYTGGVEYDDHGIPTGHDVPESAHEIAALKAQVGQLTDALSQVEGRLEARHKEMYQHLQKLAGQTRESPSRQAVAYLFEQIATFLTLAIGVGAGMALGGPAGAVLGAYLAHQQNQIRRMRKMRKGGVYWDPETDRLVVVSGGDVLVKAEKAYAVPAGAAGNARKVLAWREKYGSEVKGMTSVGWARARQLASQKTVSLDTVKRMSAFNRHRSNAKVDPKYTSEPWKDRGYVAWLGWGGDTGVDWARRITGALDKADDDDGLDDAVSRKIRKLIREEGKPQDQAVAIALDMEERGDLRSDPPVFAQYPLRKGDKVPGGLADNRKPSDFDEEQLAAGIAVEMEHTDDPDIAREIAMDHLTEDSDYYRKLKTIEKSRRRRPPPPSRVLSKAEAIRAGQRTKRSRRPKNQHGHRDGLRPGDRLTIRKSHVTADRPDYAIVSDNGAFLYNDSEYPNGRQLLAAITGNPDHHLTIRRYFRLEG